MNKSVTVVSNEDGKVITVSPENDQYGHIRVTQERVVFDDNGWAKMKKLSALVLGTVEDLERFNWKDGQKIPGCVRIWERLTPFNKKDPDKNLKRAGDTGVVCMKGHEPIYRNTFYSPSGAPDELVAHTNGDEIRAAKTGDQGEGKGIEEFNV